MKQFLKYVLATITGLFILAGIFFLVLISMVGGVKKSTKVEIAKEAVLELKLNYDVPDRTAPNPFEQFDFELSGDLSQPVGMYDIIRSINHAKEDENIKGIFLDLTFIGSGYGKLGEIREALMDFKESGKFVYAYGEYFYNQTYYFASVADKIFLNPQGSMIFNGMAAEVTFMKETLAKLGIEMQAIKHGKFKGAVEPLTKDKLSDDNRHQIDEYLNSVYNQFLASIGTSRGISADQLKEISNGLKVTNPENALTNKLVDQLAYRDEVLSAMRTALELEDDKDVEFVKMAKYKKSLPSLSIKIKDHIAVVYASGSIVSGKGQSDEIGSDKFAAAIRKARKDDDVKAVVLRVNSRGGSALASDVIWRETQLLKKEKPLIVSMGDVAASGGYYISCLADTIVAMPNTITGSIGVFALFPNAEKMFDKLGMHSEYVKTSEYADFGRIDRPLNSKEKEVLTEVVENIYEEFVGRVSEGRGLTTEYIDSVAQGRVWTGTMAKERGLVDVHGGLMTAIKIAADKAGLEDYTVESYPKPKAGIEEFFMQFGGVSTTEKILERELGTYYKTYKNIQRLEKISGIQAIMPYSINLN